MPTPQLDIDVCEWLERSEEEAGSTPREDLSRLAAATSTLEEDKKGTAPTESRPKIFIGFDHTWGEVDLEQRIWNLVRAAHTKDVRRHLDEAADALAAQLNITRHELDSRARAEFIKRHEEDAKSSKKKTLTERLNESYDEEAEREDEHFFRASQAYYRRRRSSAKD